jgi:hypothetical protein
LLRLNARPMKPVSVRMAPASISQCGKPNIGSISSTSAQ